MKFVLISIPAGDTEYAKRCVADAFRREEAGFLFDALYAGFDDLSVGLDKTVKRIRQKHDPNRADQIVSDIEGALRRTRSARPGPRCHSAVVAIASRSDSWAFYLDRGITEAMLVDVDVAVAAGFRPEYEPADIYPSVNPPYEKRISFRVFRDGHDKDLSLDIRLRDCARWPLLLAKFEQHARREWDLPR